MVSDIKFPWIWGGQSEHNVSNSFLVIIFPVLDFLLALVYLALRQHFVRFQWVSVLVESDVPWAGTGQDTPLAL